MRLVPQLISQILLENNLNDAMQPIDLPPEFQINSNQCQEKTYCDGFIFKNTRDGRPIRLQYRANSLQGIVVTSIHDLDTNLFVVLMREAPNRLSFNLFSVCYCKMIKRISFPIQSAPINSRHILRFCSKKQKLIHYHESHANIEIRNSASLKLISTYSLAEICKDVGLANRFSDLRTSIDLDCIPHLSSMILLLGSKIVLVPEKKTKQKPAVVFDLGGNERYRSITYKEKQRVVLVIGLSSMLIIGLDDIGISSLPII